MPAAAQQKLQASDLISLANSGKPGFSEAITSTFAAKTLQDGTAWVEQGPDFFCAIKADAQPSLIIDDGAAMPMRSIAGSKLWYGYVTNLQVGKSHTFHYLVRGAEFGGSFDVPGLGPMSYAMPGVPQGKLSEKRVNVSKIYDGMKSEYWVYVPAEYDASVPAALMVIQDGESYTHRDGRLQALNVFDNLIAAKRIPVTIFVMVNPGDITGSPGTPTFEFVSRFADEHHRTLKDAMRSTLYDTVSDRYVRFLRDELLPEALANLNVRTDAYSHAIAGGSSGGICAFNAAWQMPDEFSRVHSWVGSFTDLQWHERPDIAEGGQDFPDMVLRGPKRNIRVWSQDGANDLDRGDDSWPLNNLRMANALKLSGYDFHFSFGRGTHNVAQGASEFPESLTWLWRDYDPKKTWQTFEQDAAEKAKPVFRVAIVNR